jgi:hypothetical protein
MSSHDIAVSESTLLIVRGRNSAMSLLPIVDTRSLRKIERFISN